eukprot:14011754-Alexandrium_andersonii.AAC.1
MVGVSPRICSDLRNELARLATPYGTIIPRAKQNVVDHSSSSTAKVVPRVRVALMEPRATH